MKKFKGSLAVLLAWLPLWAMAGYSPPKVQAVLKTMYPQATGVAWSMQGNYYVARLVAEGWDTAVWIDLQAKWVMTLTDWGSTDELPPAVYNAFASGIYAAEQVEDVTQATFPRSPTVIVIKVGRQNLDADYQLFYTPNGTLERTCNLGFAQGELTPATFTGQ